jgi:tetratricopeptide (TPR) repeat protein
MKRLNMVFLLVVLILGFSAPQILYAQQKKVVKVKSKEELERLKKEQEKEVNYKKALNRGNDLYRVGKYSAAIKSYKESIKWNPNNPKAYYGLGLCYNKLRQYSKAVESFQKSIQQDNQYWKAYYALGNAYLKLNKFDQAINAYLAASKLTKNYKVFYQLGYVYYKKNNPAKAAEFYKKAVGIKNTYGKGWLNLAVVSLDLKQYKATVQAAQKALKFLKKRKDKAKAYYLTGEGYFHLGQFAKAKEAYTKVTSLTNTGFYYGGANFGLGMIAKKKGNLALAKKYFRNAVRVPAWRAKAEYELKKI